jgi:hypothetical protein
MMHNTIFATRYFVSMLSPINHLSGLICRLQCHLCLEIPPDTQLTLSYRLKRRSVVSSSSAPRSTSRSIVTKNARRSASPVLRSRMGPTISQPRTSWSSLSVSKGKFQYLLFKAPADVQQYQQDRTKTPQDPSTSPSSPDQQWCLCSHDQGHS